MTEWQSIQLDDETVDALKNVARGLQNLGMANAATPMGAIELLAMEVRNGCAGIAAALDNLADAIREHGK